MIAGFASTFSPILCGESRSSISRLRTDYLTFRYMCGHSHCYACIRRWLEYKWTCPTCRAGIICSPFPNEAKAEAIARDHPEWVDLSTVTYSFKGLRFPIPDPRTEFY
jgi:hypothetical protein